MKKDKINNTKELQETQEEAQIDCRCCVKRRYSQTIQQSNVAHRRVFRVCSHEFFPGEIMAIMHVRAFAPIKESRSTFF